MYAMSNNRKAKALPYSFFLFFRLTFPISRLTSSRKIIFQKILDKWISSRIIGDRPFKPIRRDQ